MKKGTYVFKIDREDSIDGWRDPTCLRFFDSSSHDPDLTLFLHWIVMLKFGELLFENVII